MWVTNGRALAPPWIACSIGVSTSRKPRAAMVCADCHDHRRLRASTMRRESGLMIRST